MANITTHSPSHAFTFRTPPHKYEDEESLALVVGLGPYRDIDRWHSRREFLKSYKFSGGRSNIKEKMKRSARKIGLRVYKLTLIWPSVFVMRCYVPLPCLELEALTQDHMHHVLVEHMYQPTN